jgi:hypothetical protein
LILNSLIKIIWLIKLIPKLGLFNVLYAVYYKTSVKLQFRKRVFKIEDSVEGLFFNPEIISIKTDYPFNAPHLLSKADKLIDGNLSYFSYHEFKVGSPPDWLYDPFNQITYDSSAHWMDISDFSSADIKIIWEASRFDWLTDLARAYCISGNRKYLDTINSWLSDWSRVNRLNQGPNWKCGQEASFRLMKMLTTLSIFQQLNSPEKSLIILIYQHVERIQANITYALIQKNNHSTSESISLYIGSTWLINQGLKDTKLTKWKNQGRNLIEKCAIELIQKDGSFSQRSMNYHRVAVDSFSFCLHMMSLLNEPEFSEKIKTRLTALGEWQYKMIFGSHGDAPNYGSNDGAMIENLHDLGYRDFRPSLQLFLALLTKQRAYNDNTVSEPLYWRFGLAAFDLMKRNISKPNGEILDDHILILRNKRTTLLLVIPDDTFRPGNDPFHIDLWIDGKPQLIDSGSYSYNSGTLSDYFKSVRAHNTVQFGTEEPMPKIGRFLNAEWIKASKIGIIEVNEENLSWEGVYTDYRGNTHQRLIKLYKNKLVIIDKLKSKKQAVCRFHLSKKHSLLDIDANKRSDISLFYLHKESQPLIEKSFNTGKMITEFYWN